MTVVGGLEGAGLVGKLNAGRAEALVVVKIRKPNVSSLECFMMFATGTPCAGREQAWRNAGRRVKELGSTRKSPPYFCPCANMTYSSSR